MKKSRLQISTNFSLPIELVTSTQAILARKRSGKSYLAQVETEEMLEQGAQVGVFDPTGAWWGLKSSADGKSAGYSIVIFGGRNADAPLDFRAGKAMATAFLDRGFSAVFDISLFTLPQQLQFVMEFCDEILRVNRNALHLVIDEADTFAPQTPRSKLAGECLGTVSRLVSQGGLGGTGITMITQRSAKINWDVLSQIDVLTVLRMGAPLDIKPVVGWLKANATEEFADEVGAALPSLPVGTAFITSAHLDIAQRVEVRQKRTFNSGATPKPGERKIVPKVFAEVDAKLLGEQIAESIAVAKANSPDELKARIRELERQLAKPTPAVADTAAVKIMNEKMQGLTKRLSTALASHARSSIQLSKVRKIAATLALAVGDEGPETESPIKMAHEVSAALPRAHAIAPSKPLPLPAPRPARIVVVDGSKRLTGTALKVAQIAAGYAQRGESIKRSVLAAMCGVSMGGSFSARLSEARTAGAITIDGGIIAATSEGLTAYAGQFRAPETTEDVMALWLPKLGSAGKGILEYLVGLGGADATRSAIAEAIGMSLGGSFSARLSEVRSTGLLVERGGAVAANREVLFL